MKIRILAALVSSLLFASCASPETAIEKVNRLTAEGKFDLALDELNRQIEKNPEFFVALTARGNLYVYCLNEREKGVQDLEEAVRLDSSAFSRTVLAKARIWSSRPDYSGALADLNRAIALDPKFAPAYAYRALIHFDLKRMDKAFVDVNKAIECDPNYADAYCLRAEIRAFSLGAESLNEFPEPKADMEKAQAIEKSGKAGPTIRVMRYLGPVR